MSDRTSSHDLATKQALSALTLGALGVVGLSDDSPKRLDYQLATGGTRQSKQPYE